MAVDTAPAATQARSWSITKDLKGAASIWQRELIRFFRERARAVTSFVQPLLYLLVFGTGLGAAIRGGGASLAGAGEDVSFQQFLLPGVIIMTALFTSMMGAMSILWDREFGFLREILVSPVARSAVVLGKTAGGATTAAIQGMAILIFAPLVGMSVTPLQVVIVLPIVVLFSLAMNLFGAAVGSRMQTMQSFMVVFNFLTLPLFFLSGAVFPINTAPPVLRIAAYFNPATYAVDAVRRTLIEGYPPALTFAGQPVPIAADLAIMAGLGAVMFAFALRGFNRQP